MKLPNRPTDIPADVRFEDVGNTRRNAFWMACDHDGGRVNYAACLTKTAIIKISPAAGEHAYPTCSKAVRSGTCQCVDMRREEIGAGKAIWFIQRPDYDPANDPVPVTVEQRAERIVSEKTGSSWRSKIVQRGAGHSQPAPRRAMPVAGGETDYAQAINAQLAAERVAKKQHQIKPNQTKSSEINRVDLSSNHIKSSAATTPSKALSLIERARTMMANKNQ
ncbi:hypothetical protein [Chromobacterium phragmitis]|uniref:Uncharacterized protein n=1 Tax=Chromobacterium phragmitis TaxID=2202141 RepID=A0ABV0J112_9NEIS